MSQTRLPAAERRDQILDVALGVFATNGYHDTSMNDVAEAAGVTKPVLYHHFDSKRELYRALLDLAGDRLLSSIRDAVAGATTGKEMTSAGFLGYFRWVADDHNAFRLLFDGDSRRDREFNAQVRRTTEEVAAAVGPWIDVDIDPDHRATLAHAVVGMAEGASRRLVDHGTVFDPDVLASQLSGLAWAGLRGVRRSAAEPA